MKAMKTFAALLALAFSLTGCGAVDGDPVRPASGSAGQGSSTAAFDADSADPEQLAAMRQLAGENGELAGVLYLGSVPERTTDVHAVLDSLPEQPWQFVADIPADRWVAVPGGGRELYCIFAVRGEDTLFVYEKQDSAYPAQLGKELYGRQGGQPILLLCNGSKEDTDTMATVYCSTGRTLDWNPQLSAETGSPVPVEGVCDFTIYPEGDDWETDTSPWSLEGNWLETGRDTDEGYFDTDPADADRMCFLPVDGDTEGSQLPFTASYITIYPELNVEEADLFYQEGTPEVPFQTNQEWYATFTGPHGDRYAVTLEDEDTLALKVYLDGQESYLSLVNTVYFARQEAMG